MPKTFYIFQKGFTYTLYKVTTLWFEGQYYCSHLTNKDTEFMKKGGSGLDGIFSQMFKFLP